MEGFERVVGACGCYTVQWDVSDCELFQLMPSSDQRCAGQHMENS